MHGIPSLRQAFRPVTIAGVRLIFIPSAAKGKLVSTPKTLPFTGTRNDFITLVLLHNESSSRIHDQ